MRIFGKGRHRPSASWRQATDRAFTLIGDGRYEDAGELLTRAADLEPWLSESWFNLALLHKFRHDWEQARAAGLRAVALLDRETGAPDWWNVGIAATALQDWPLAIQEYRAAYGAEQRAEYLFGLGQAQRQNGEFAAAITSFKAYKRMESVSAQQATAAELLITKCEAELLKEEAAALAKKNAQAAPQAPAPAPVAPAAPAQAARPSPSADERPKGPKAFYEDFLGDALFVGGLGAAGAGAFLLFSGNSDMKNSSSLPTEGAAQAAADSAHSKQVMGAVLLPVGCVLLGAAIWRWVSVGSADRSATTGLVLGPTYVGYAGKF